MRRYLNTCLLGLAAVSALTLCSTAAASNPDYSGQVNISGATLFADFFASRSQTNDFINIDGDFDCHGLPYAGYDATRATDPNCGDLEVDQLAEDYLVGGYYWLVQQRSVGSVRGVEELIEYHTCGNFYEGAPSEIGRINRAQFAATGVATWLPIGDRCVLDNDPINYLDPLAAGDPNLPWLLCGPHPTPVGDGTANASGTPVCPTSIDAAITDVPTTYAVQNGVLADAAWNRRPLDSGYGFNPITSNTGFVSALAPLAGPCGNELNLDTGSPNAKTIFDTPVAWSPISAVANRGSGISQISMTDLQYLLISGRTSQGANYVSATRDAGSGTRNGYANSLCVDPAWARGENIGNRIDTNTLTALGPNQQSSNCGGSGIVEDAVTRRRLAIGHTGTLTSSRAEGDVRSGLYELPAIINDLYGGTLPVSVSRDSLISWGTPLGAFNPNQGYLIGAAQTFSTVGDPFATAFDVNDDGDTTDPEDIPARAGSVGNPEMCNKAAAAYLRNMQESIDAYTASGGLPTDLFMPGQFLAERFILLAGITHFNDSFNCEIVVNNDYLQSINDVALIDLSDPADPTPLDLPAYGVAYTTDPDGSRPTSERGFAGRTPTRLTTIGAYSDGRTTDYRYWNHNTAAVEFVAYNVRLSKRNALMGDFNEDGVRNQSDFAGFISAVANPLAWMQGLAAGPTTSPEKGQMNIDIPIPEVIGDMNGDGSLSKADVRYMADGLISSTGGCNDRKTGFTEVDLAFGGNYFGTTWSNAAAYANGDARFDVCGNGTGAALTTSPVPDNPNLDPRLYKGANPVGNDGVISTLDACYVHENYGDWSNKTTATLIDLSCDMNGDLRVDGADVNPILVKLGFGGDVDRDGDVDAQDLAFLLASFGANSNGCGGTPDVTYNADADMDGDGDVDAQDLAFLLANFGGAGFDFSTCP